MRHQLPVAIIGAGPVGLAAAAHLHRYRQPFIVLEAGAEPDPRQQGGHTPLHTAAHNDDAELTRVLLAHGADPGAANDAGQTPRDMAGTRVAPLLGA